MVAPTPPSSFNAEAKEAQLRREAESWDTPPPTTTTAPLRDIPILDVADYFSAGCCGAPAVEANNNNNYNNNNNNKLADQLREACTTVGFFALRGHGVDPALYERLLTAMRWFFAQDETTKRALLMDQPDFALKGVGYLPLFNRKLPTRSTANANEAYVVKHSHDIAWDDNPWPQDNNNDNDNNATNFRSVVEEYGRTMEALSKSLLPLFARALDMEADFFDSAFASPFYRLRLSHYPAHHEGMGILPHVDTTFFTILFQTHEGLMIRDERCGGDWTRVPAVPDALIVNVGELLRQWTNDYFKSVKHCASNQANENTSRYSIPFFFNANADFVMECVPSCCSPKNPPKYPPVSYRASQAAAQGE